jgi:hypothetical protein
MQILYALRLKNLGRSWMQYQVWGCPACTMSRNDLTPEIRPPIGYGFGPAEEEELAWGKVGVRPVR